jgi:oligopeptide transport system substrate-binding protein
MKTSAALLKIKKNLWLAAVLALTLCNVLVACVPPALNPSTNPSGGTNASGTLNLDGDDPVTLDPALIGDATSHDYAVQIFSGLLRLDNNLQPAADVAGNWTISPDETIYTFYLRKDVKFQDGRQVTANDFKYSWERACDPALGSTTALTYLGDIVGVKDMLAGKATSISGVKVIDDYTLQVSIDAPKSYFLSKMTYVTAFVVDKNNVQSGANWWQKPNGTGPFKVTQYTRQKQLVLTRNAGYYGDKAKVNSVVFSILQGVPMDLYETGKIDAVGVGLPYLERASDPNGPFAGQLIQSPELSVYYIGFNCAQPPFDDVNVRLAFSYAVDKQKLIDVSFKNMETDALGFLPPGIPGYNQNLTGVGFDINKAKDLIAQSKYGSVANLPPITITTSGEGGSVSGSLIAVAYQLQQNLGANITIRSLEPDRFSYSLKQEIDQMYDFGWIADYPHPQDFLDILFHSGADYNYGGYSNADVDALIDQAGKTQNFTVSAALYQQAEQKLVDTGAALPLFFSQNYMLVKPYVHGYMPNALGFVMLNNVSIDSH